MSGFGDVDLKALGIPSKEEILAQYYGSVGLGDSADNQLAFYEAFQFFRIGAIVQGVYKRALQGNVIICVIYSLLYTK